MRKIANWFHSNKMALNTAKTKYMIFRTRGKQINENECQLVYITTEIGLPTDPELVSPIERVHNAGSEKTFKLLGVYFDEYLSFDSHISQLCKKISKSLFSINKIKISSTWMRCIMRSFTYLFRTALMYMALRIKQRWPHCSYSRKKLLE
jgi:hypothetical protein